MSAIRIAILTAICSSLLIWLGRWWGSEARLLASPVLLLLVLGVEIWFARHSPAALGRLSIAMTLPVAVGFLVWQGLSGPTHIQPLVLPFLLLISTCIHTGSRANWRRYCRTLAGAMLAIFSVLYAAQERSIPEYIFAGAVLVQGLWIIILFSGETLTAFYATYRTQAATEWTRARALVLSFTISMVIATAAFIHV